MKKKPLGNQFICKDCGIKFLSTDRHRVFCSVKCARHFPINQANKKWLNPKPKKKPRYTMNDLNRIAEWKRLYEDTDWDKRFRAFRG